MVEMTASVSRTQFLLLLTALLPFLVQHSVADYDSKFCDKFAKKGADDTGTPYFLKDYSVIVEKTTMKDADGEAETVVHQSIEYSDTMNQLAVSEQRKNSSMWFHVDEASNDCIMKKNDGECVDSKATCAGVAKINEMFKIEDGKVTMGSAAQSMAWPKTVKKHVKRGSSASRDIQTVSYITCAYDDDARETIVSEWQVVDLNEYPKLDQTQPKVVSVRHHRGQSGAQNFNSRLDYTSYSSLPDNKLKNGLQIGELSCGTVESAFLDKELPKPPLRMRYNTEFARVEPKHNNAYQLHFQTVVYNYDAKLIERHTYNSYGPDMEEDVVQVISDYSTSHQYTFSATKGNCTVAPKFVEKSLWKKMPTPEEYWKMSYGKRTYLGVYLNRNIPCDVWHLEGSDLLEGHSARLYLASSDWLKANNLPADHFYPVQEIPINGPGQYRKYYTFHEFKVDPGYMVPYLENCFEAEDIVPAELIILADYRKDISQRRFRFEYEFRTALKRITGIVSNIRIGYVQPIPGMNAQNEVTVAFILFGTYKHIIDGSEEDAYAADPVTTKDAITKINKAVDKGLFKFSIENSKVEVHFKKGSLSVIDRNDWKLRVRDGKAGYSSGAMGGLAILLLVLGLLAAVGAVYGYKVWTERGRPGLGDGMKTLGDDL